MFLDDYKPSFYWYFFSMSYKQLINNVVWFRLIEEWELKLVDSKVDDKYSVE